ncbi:hypothetical protein LHYA1_G006249 [Lachnellula hyalina]|uniref:Uncharacterized protein n=1 Tax=Lachnellula hyalina TaxID=1316788 RepID=A0A8H8QY79_9HELO|nr:uncharacterized protein LHYA1_G006249 [Lachnellula hyalina]TVY24933.1 hypothetical protein LHYA1_G006249 [Lachnellula hyalina]
MTDPTKPGASSGGGTEPPPRRNGLPPEILDIIWPAIQIGGLSGVTGIIFGGFAGVARSSTPTLFALASGIQWFTLASTFSASRGFVLQSWGGDKVSPKEKVSVSAIAGAFAGSAGGLLRGRKNILPGAIMFALFGAAGQAVYNRSAAQNSNMPQAATDKSEKFSWMNSKWSPMSVLSDAEYEKLLQERLLRINAEIALVDENIEALRAQEKDITAKNIASESKDLNTTRT